MKPDWKDAPEWANYMAMDRDGSWWWYQNKPKANVYEEAWLAKSKEYERCDNCDFWKETLEKRP